MATNNEHFYTDLPVNSIPLGDLLVKDHLFHTIPADWCVILTDIRGSTQAVLNGMHENVNLIATGSIVAVLNLAFKAGITVPFFFGGDGATFLVPPAIVDKVMQALQLYKVNTQVNFGLELRTGTFPVKRIYEEGYKLRICKFCISEAFCIPVVLGDGLNFAEKQIKGYDIPSEYLTQREELDLTGMQCRWDKIAPPENNDEILTLLVKATSEDQQPQVFRKVVRHIDQIYGTPQKRQPISVAKLKLKTSFNRLGMEMRARLGKIRFFELLQDQLTTLYGYFYFRTQRGKSYLNSLVEMSDTLVIDGKINTVISGTAGQRKKLQDALDKMEKNGELFYGFHVSNESVMSCYVRNMDDGHIHFVDGSEGGYTMAAGFMKRKLSKLI